MKTKTWIALILISNVLVASGFTNGQPATEAAAVPPSQPALFVVVGLVCILFGLFALVPLLCEPGCEG